MADADSIDARLQVARFWSQVEVRGPTQCWPWRGAIMSDYPSVGLGSRTWRAHQIAYRYTFGHPGDGVILRHSCDNPRCCNPLHLATGTHADNVRDRVLRDRSAKGEKNGRAKLDANAVRRIREVGTRVSAQELARQYGVDRTAISHVLKRRSWKHVT